MDYVKNWEQTKKRFDAFWNQEIIDRCCVAVTSPNHHSKHNESTETGFDFANSTREQKDRFWLDPETIVKRELDVFEKTYFAGEAFPQIFMNFGASGQACFYEGAKFRFEDTLWIFPSIENLAQQQPVFDPESPMYKTVLEAARYYATESKGRYFISLPDTCSDVDSLAMLRGNAALMLDFFDKPEAVHEALQTMTRHWKEYEQKICDIIMPVNEGGSTVGWMQLWGPGKMTQLQCDESVMYSPAQFSEYVMPELTEKSQWLDNTIYHLDGIEQIRHLDNLLSIDSIKAIQWTQVVGQPSALDEPSLAAIKRIQAAGKSVLIFAEPNQIEPLMTNLSSKGLFLVTEASDEAQSDEIVKLVSKLTHE